MRIIYPDDIAREFDAVAKIVEPYIFMNTEKHILDFVADTPQKVKDRYFALLDRVHAFENAIGVAKQR